MSQLRFADVRACNGCVAWVISTRISLISQCGNGCPFPSTAPVTRPGSGSHDPATDPDAGEAGVKTMLEMYLTASIPEEIADCCLARIRYAKEVMRSVPEEFIENEPFVTYCRECGRSWEAMPGDWRQRR